MNIMVSYLTKNEMDRLEKGNHQGYILEIPDFKYYDEKRCFLILKVILLS